MVINTMDIFRHYKIYTAISAIVITAAVASVAFFGLQMGIEFTGGSVLEVEYPSEERPSVAEIRDQLSGIDLGSYSVQHAGENAALLRMPEISPETHNQILEQLGDSATELQFELIGPIIGQELREQTGIIAVASVIVILGYIMFAFRRIQRPLHSWQYSIASIVPSIHDIVIVLGVFAYLGYAEGVQFTIPVVVGLLTVFGYSLNDTVVVFDRVRENLLREEPFGFREALNNSFRETLVRNINTTVTTLLVVFAIFFFGGETLRDFSLTLIVGLTVGFYSSLLLGPSILYMLGKKQAVEEVEES